MRRAVAVAALAVSIFATAHGPVGEGGRYGAGGGAVCGTDGQCRAYAREVLIFDTDDRVGRVYYADPDDGETITHG